jgi:hypothetical protein
MSIKKADYEPIPDVETGTLQSVTVDPKQRYPEANEREAELLGILDSCVESPHIHLDLPKFTSQDVATSESNFLKSFLFPTIVTALILATFYLTTTSTEVLAIVAFILVFASIIPPSQKRLSSAAETALGAIKATKDVLEAILDDTRRRFDETVDNVQSKLVQVIEPLRPTLEKATRLEKQLQAVDPDIDIPTVDDILTELADAKDKMGASLQNVLNSITIDTLIPRFLVSPNAFHYRITIPILFICFTTQAVGTYIVWLVTLAGNGPSKSIAPVLAPSVFAFFLLYVVIMITSTTAIATHVCHVRETAYTNLQLGLCDHGADQSYHEVFGDRMGKIREKLLALIRKVSKIEPILKTVSISVDTPSDLRSKKKKETATAVTGAEEATTTSVSKATSTLTRMGSWGVGNIFGSKK